MYKGIPDNLRGNLWQLLSGSIYYLKVNVAYFPHLLKFYEKRNSYCVDDIEKDLHRSFPEHPFFQSEKGLLSLKNVNPFSFYFYLNNYKYKINK